MTPLDMITKRRSVRSYTGIPMADTIKRSVLGHLENLRPLFDELPFYAEFSERDRVKSILPMPWAPPDILMIYAEDSIPSRMNAGFLLATLDLHLQEAGLGACWLGVGRPVDGGTFPGQGSNLCPKYWQEDF